MFVNEKFNQNVYELVEFRYITSLISYRSVCNTPT